jgi:branched-subunit amino acid aminotransferase/4-amino-4-deoxychorismate lyase
VRADDAGLLLGWGVFETLAIAGGEPLLLERHLERMARGARTLSLPLDLSGVRRQVGRCLAASGVREGRLRITLTAGPVPPGLPAPAAVAAPTLLVSVTAVSARPAAAARLALVDVRRPSPRAVPTHVKAIAFLPSLLARHAALSRGSPEALMLSETGHLAEADAANLFWVEGAALVTPALATGALEGITRGLVIELARELGVSVREGRYPPGRLRQAGEVFVTSTLRGVQPVGEVRLQSGEVLRWQRGPVARRFAAALRVRIKIASRVARHAAAGRARP